MSISVYSEQSFGLKVQINLLLAVLAVIIYLNPKDQGFKNKNRVSSKVVVNLVWSRRDRITLNVLTLCVLHIKLF